MRTRPGGDRRDTWPVVYLHFNVRGLEAVHLQSIWETLGRYESWLTTAERRADEHDAAHLGPLMVLTEGGQEDVFYNRVPDGRAGSVRHDAARPRAGTEARRS
jgi:hypothetical protein